MTTVIFPTRIYATHPQRAAGMLTGTHGTMPTEPSGDTHVVGFHTAASQTFGNATATMQPNSGPTQRPVHTENTHPPPATTYGPMVDLDGTVNSTNTGTSVATHSTANPTNNTIIGTIDAPPHASTATAHGKKRHRKQSHKTQDSRKHHRRMAGFTATHDDTPGPDPDPDEGHSVRN